MDRAFWRSFFTAVRVIALTIVLTGVIYPLAVWAAGAVLFPRQAGGSLVTDGGTTVGSRLVGQRFTSARYFHGRPSAAGDGYDAMASGPSNLGPTNRKLIDDVRARVADAGGGAVPVDLVTSSASGLDPHVSLDSAYYQAARVAGSRGLSEDRVRRLVAEHAEGRLLGFLGEPRVNVLELNLALDGLK